jgi:AcrR family transcriptional regulator
MAGVQETEQTQETDVSSPLAAPLDPPRSDDVDIEPSRGGRPRDEAREQAILDAAIDLLAEVGYEAMTIEGVAIRAKCSKATIYRRWPGKAELVAEAMRRRAEPVLEDLPDTGSLRGDLLVLVARLVDGMQGIDGGLICGLAVAVRSDAQFGQLLASHLHEQKLRSVATLVTRAEARGEIPPGVDPSILLKVAPGVALFHQMNGEPLDAAFAEYLVDRILFPLLRP